MTGPPKAEVWQADFSGSRGHEQKGERPCILWRDLDHIGMAIVIPLTGSIEKEGFPHTCLISPTASNGLTKESIVLVFQMASIDKKRLVRKLGVLTEEETHVVGAVLKDLLRI